MYDISGGIAGTLGYPNEQHTYSLGGNILQYPAASYQGSLRQRDIAQQAYTIPYTGNQDYCDYGQQVSTYDSYPPYTTANTILQDPSQNHATNLNQEQLASWNQDFHTSCNTFEDSTQPVSRSPIPPAIQRSLVTPSQYSSTLANTTSSTIPDGMLSKLPQQIPLTSSVPTIVIPSGTGERSHWPDDYDSQTGSMSSRRSSQDTSSERSSSTQGSLIEHGIGPSLDSGIYSLLPASALENPLPLAEQPLNNIQPHTAYVQHQMADKYQYHYATLKPAPPSVAVPASTTDAASLASIGNHTFAHLPPYRPVDKCGTLQYQIHNGVRKAPSRIAVEIASSGAGRRTDN